jgi:hypothetical protein
VDAEKEVQRLELGFYREGKEGESGGRGLMTLKRGSLKES